MNKNMGEYKVLWIDDEYQNMDLFIEWCLAEHNIVLVPFKTRREGMEELEEHINEYDAVILDAKACDESENELPNLEALRNARDRINQLALIRYLPMFIFTGQPDLLSNRTFENIFGNYYEKHTDNERLIRDLLQSIKDAPKRQIINRHSKVFNALDQLGLDITVKEHVLDMLQIAYSQEETSITRHKLYYNFLRQLVEHIFRSFNRIGLIPDEFIINGKINLNQSSLYISGKNPQHIGLRYGKEGDRIVPRYIENILRLVLDLGNKHSHTTDLEVMDENQLNDFFHQINSRYLIPSLIMQMCEVIIWCSDYAKRNNNKEINLSHCTKIEYNQTNE